jgi:K(+)-stimulated pyrophosphate-energized sodium pump
MQNWKTITRIPGTQNKLIAWLLALLAIFAPTLALAAGGEANIKLEFSDSDRIYLFASLAFGAIALIAAVMLWNQVKAASAGNEKMQEVGTAIREGALAYLRQQMRMMAGFVLALTVILYFMYVGKFGSTLALFTAISFVAGVAASYFAGYVGMVAAVNANVRVAHAALSSYKNALEIAFRSGAVAGLVTVGMGLLGATLIFLFFPSDATKLLIGFGFGGSLAALFMRVGGGIFTKAADVGADLVGKVEAGIPEDDPRNPAVIADNVGDNVGDCAGMAADVFESYEVTLVAAIVLGAATAAIFPTEMWMRLILFALMARGAGIIASIVGILMVKGSDDINADPLKAIGKGFYGSAAIAAVATAGLALYMLGGMNPAQAIKANQLVTANQVVRDQNATMLKAAYALAAKNKVALNEVKPEDVLKDPDVVKLGMVDKMLKRSGQTDAAAKQQAEDMVKQAAGAVIQGGDKSIPEATEFDGYKMVNFKDTKSAIYNFAFVDQTGAQGAPEKYLTLGEANKTGLAVFEIEATRKAVDQQGKPIPGQADQVQKAYLGLTTRANLENQIKQVAQFDKNTTYKIVNEYKATLYANESNELIGAINADPSVVDLSSVQSQQIGYATSKAKAEEYSKSMANQGAGATPPTPPAALAPQLAYQKQTTAEWWKFFGCVLFGIIMAFVFEKLTDYYVGLHKRPVQELGAVSTAGPAPMIITGFAYGKESSVFSVFAIVACLIAPLLLFPPADYGGYLLSFYGIALVGLGLLTTTGFVLAMDTFGPISDNSQGVFEMSGAHHDSPEGARRVQLLDAAGNTTKALTKGFAIATAVVAAVALFHAYVEDSKLTQIGMRLEVPEIFLGLLIGGAAPYLFSAFSINAVGRAAFELINEVRSQFRNDPGIMAGTSKPNYAKCVAIVTRAAQTELLGPGILAIFFPVLVGFGFAIGKPVTMINGVEYNLVGAQALGGFLAGAILSGQLMAVLLANAGGMWDNSKKLIEDGLHGGKGTDAHKAAVVCDTVGDPFKDTAGPALNPLIKVMNLVALLLAPAVITKRDDMVTIMITLFAAAMLVIAIWWSKRGGMGSGMAKAEAAESATEA